MRATDGILRGKRVVVAGSSTGIGRAVAERLLREGARVVINGRGVDALQQTLDELASGGGDVLASAGSVADFDYAGELIDCCVRGFGGIDVLINCAGIAEPAATSILNIDPGDWRHVLDVHLGGTFNTCRHAAPIMATSGGGTIINSGSHAFLGSYGGTGYAAGKGATNSLSCAMAVDLAASGINVNVVCPGAKTRLSTGEQFIQQIESLYRRGALSDERRASALNPAHPDYVAALYAFLASDLASDITGQVFWGSGGYIGRFRLDQQELLAAMDGPSDQPWKLQDLAAALNPH